MDVLHKIVQIIAQSRAAFSKSDSRMSQEENGIRTVHAESVQRAFSDVVSVQSTKDMTMQIIYYPSRQASGDAIMIEQWYLAHSGRVNVSERQLAMLLRSVYLHCRILPIYREKAKTLSPLLMSYSLQRGPPATRMDGSTKRVDLLKLEQKDGSFQVSVEYVVTLPLMVPSPQPQRSSSFNTARSASLKREIITDQSSLSRTRSQTFNDHLRMGMANESSAPLPVQGFVAASPQARSIHQQSRGPPSPLSQSQPKPGVGTPGTPVASFNHDNVPQKIGFSPSPRPSSLKRNSSILLEERTLAKQINFSDSDDSLPTMTPPSNTARVSDTKNKGISPLASNHSPDTRISRFPENLSSLRLFSDIASNEKPVSPKPRESLLPAFNPAPLTNFSSKPRISLPPSPPNDDALQFSLEDDDLDSFMAEMSKPTPKAMFASKRVDLEQSLNAVGSSLQAVRSDKKSQLF